MTYPTMEQRDQIDATKRALAPYVGLDKLEDRELNDVAGICYKLGCTPSNFVRMLIQMGLDSLARTDTGTLMYIAAACGGRPELELAVDELPF